MKKLIKLNSKNKKINNLINKWDYKVNIQLSKGEVQIASKHEKVFSVLIYQVNGNLHFIEMVSHFNKYGCHKKNQMLVRKKDKGNPCTIYVVM